MKLAIDIGNTQIKLGVFDKIDLVYSSSFDDIGTIENQFKKINKFNPTVAIISSVVPKITLKLKKEILKILKINTFIINCKNCNINLNVPHPETVGVDRICNVAATLKLYNSPAIIIDFGTATTYDVIDEDGRFIGGIIAPGIKTSAEHLIKKAALLNDTDLLFPKNIIGTNTTENIQSGIMYGAVDQVKGMVSRINNELKIKNNIVLTGGFSKILSSKLSFNHIVDINLTLKGMMFINESNN